MARILIIDDSPTETYKFALMLKKKGFETIEANSAEEGIALTKRDKPDLILMDVVMPGLNGFQATRQLSRDPQTKDIPVVIVTTKDQETDRVWGKRQGAVGYLTKPVTDTVLISAVQKVLDGEAIA